MKKVKEISKSQDADEIDINIEVSEDLKDKSTKKANSNDEALFSDKKDEIEITDELNNARKKRRRSSASIE